MHVAGLHQRGPGCGGGAHVKAALPWEPRGGTPRFLRVGRTRRHADPSSKQRALSRLTHPARDDHSPVRPGCDRRTQTTSAPTVCQLHLGWPTPASPHPGCTPDTAVAAEASGMWAMA